MNYLLTWKWSRIDKNVYLLVDLLDELSGSEMVRLWWLSIILEFFNSLHVLLVLVSLVRSIATLRWNWVKVPRLQILLGFPRHAYKRRSSCDPCFSECYFWSFGGLSCLLRTVLVSIFFDNFYNAFLQRRLVRNDGLNPVSQKLFSALRTSKFSTFAFCSGCQWIWWFTFLDFFVSVITSASLVLLSKQSIHYPLKRKCLSSFCTSVYTPYTFFTFFSCCCQSTFCDRVMISCSIHGVDELYSSKESLRHSSFLVE